MISLCIWDRNKTKIYREHWNIMAESSAQCRNDNSQTEEYLQRLRKWHENYTQSLAYIQWTTMMSMYTWNMTCMYSLAGVGALPGLNAQPHQPSARGVGVARRGGFLRRIVAVQRPAAPAYRARGIGSRLLIGPIKGVFPTLGTVPFVVVVVFSLMALCAAVVLGVCKALCVQPKMNVARHRHSVRIGDPTLDTNSLIPKSQNFGSTPDTQTPLHGPYKIWVSIEEVWYPNIPISKNHYPPIESPSGWIDIPIWYIPISRDSISLFYRLISQHSSFSDRYPPIFSYL